MMNNHHDDIANVCRILFENKINGVGFLSDNGSLTGIISKTDIVKAIATLDSPHKLS